MGTYRHRKNTAGVEEAGADAFLVQPDNTHSQGIMDKNIIWDEFSGSSCDIKYLLQLTDRYPMTVRGLYTTYNFVGYKIWITSNLNPDEWYPNAHPEHKNALQRRLNEFGSVINKTAACGANSRTLAAGSLPRAYLIKENKCFSHINRVSLFLRILKIGVNKATYDSRIRTAAESDIAMR